MSARSVPRPLFVIGDVGWTEVRWPIHAVYRLSEPDADTGAVRVWPAGRQVNSWNPGGAAARPTLFRRLLELHEATDAAIEDWATKHGLPGTMRLSLRDGDETYRVRELAGHLRRCWDVLTALDIQPTADHRELERLTERLPHPHQDPALSLEIAAARPQIVAARHKALATLARAIEPQIEELLTIDTVPVLSGSTVGIRARFVANGPFGAAFATILALLTTHAVQSVPGHPYHWRGPRQCGRFGCVVVFAPRTKLSRYCSARCRKLAWLERAQIPAA